MHHDTRRCNRLGRSPFWTIGAAVLLALAIDSRPVAVEAPTPLTGDMVIAGATLVDPPPDEPKQARAYLHLSGAAARRLFDALKSKAAGQVFCSAGSKAADAECDFAIDLASGATAPGNPC